MKIFFVLIQLMCFLCTSCAVETTPLFPCSKYLIEPYGTTVHIALKHDDYPYRDSLLLLAKNLGMTYIRYDFNPNQKSNIWQDAIQSVKSKGLKNYVVLDKGKKERRPWDNYKLYKQYLDASVLKYRNDVSAWEIMNNVDILWDGSNLRTNKIATKGYTSVLPQIIKYIKKNSPQSDIMMGSICLIETDFFNTLFEKNYFDKVKAFDFHSYRSPEELIIVFEKLKKKMDKYKCYPPFWLTECGMSTELDSNKVNIKKNELEKEQAQRVARIHLLSFAYGVEKVFWYNLRSLEKNPYNKESHFGLLHRDLSPKPSYYAYKALTTMCPSGSLRPKLIVKDGTYLCDWIRPDGNHVWAVWNPVGEESFNIEIKGKCVFVDFMGNEITKPNHIGASVIYIVGDKRTNVIL